jgi:hypothetical protein
MMLVPELRLSELLLAFVFQARIILSAIVSVVPWIENSLLSCITQPFGDGMEE